MGEYSTVSEHFLNDALSNASSSYGNVALAMKWNLTGQLNPGSNINFTGALGVGGSYNQMRDAIDNILLIEAQNVTDLCVVRASIDRNGETYTPFG